LIRKDIARRKNYPGVVYGGARSIAKTLRVVHSTMLLHLHDSIGFRLFRLHWVSHLLTHNLCENRKEYTKAMLPFLLAVERDGWHHLVASDELYFFLDISLRRMWTLSRDDVVTKQRLDIQSKNLC
jgi:hypothetical protein